VAAYANRSSTLDLPRPYRAAAPLVALALAAVLLDTDPSLPWAVGVLAGGCFAVSAAVRAARARLELAAVRRTADRLIVHDTRVRDASELVRWRCAELTARAELDSLAREVERVIDDLDPRKLPGASPLRRPAAGANRDVLHTIADRLGSSNEVSARGVLLVRSLLRDGGSPLYADDAEALLRRALVRALGALEP
jgi:hypothetical protein